MTVRELREKYLRFFESKGHIVHASGSLIPYDVTGRLDESLLFNGAGMVQFKPYFRGVATPPSKRLTTAQKCVRTGDIDEVGDDSHLTFFEMLGNFSFGDYFKHEAIAFSWEFLTSPEWLGLDPKRLSFTVFEEDDGAFECWSAHLTAAGIDPFTRLFRLGEETNYWPAGSFSKGPPGPCGPNSEMFYWTDPLTVPGTAAGDYSRSQWIEDDEAKNWLEIWNDVFIQYEWQGVEGASGWEKTGLPSLPFASIDTGMGLERTIAVLNGFNSVYDTDAFSAIFAKIDSLRVGGIEVSETPIPKSLAPSEQGVRDFDVARRIIADHIRTACFCIADGVLPANNGRGYVLRRLIRRAVLKGQRTLGFDEPFMHKVAEAVFETFGGHYTELGERRETIVETLKSEEALFRRTLHRGTDLLLDHLGSRVEILDGDTAFQLYDTFGFPLEVTQELCAEAGIEVDLVGYKRAMEEAQQRSRGAQGEKSAYGGLDEGSIESTEDASSETRFVGYTERSANSKVVRVNVAASTVALDQTPFYGESGGQVGDSGELVLAGELFPIKKTTKSAGTFWHQVDGDVSSLLGQTVLAQIDCLARARTQRNHTATHLLQAALRQVVGTTVTQAGSYVGPDNLRFDFTHGSALTQEQLSEVELLVNQEILSNRDVTTYADLAIDEAKAKGAMALFGEKYGDKVRMVEIGDFSRELCGGTHVRTTGEIGLFKITSESSAASGVRRIEAITGEAAYEFTREQSESIKTAANLLKTSPKDLVSAVERAMDQLKEERKKREKAEMAAMSGSGGSSASEDVNGVSLWIQNFGDADQKVVGQAIDNEANGKPNQVTLGAVVGERITFICKVGSDAAAKGAHAGNILKEVARIAGGGGGGRADFATAGGKDASKVEEALAAAKSVLASQLKA